MLHTFTYGRTPDALIADRARQVCGDVVGGAGIGVGSYDIEAGSRTLDARVITRADIGVTPSVVETPHRTFRLVWNLTPDDVCRLLARLLTMSEDWTISEEISDGASEIRTCILETLDIEEI
jgi:hypothetical protein